MAGLSVLTRDPNPGNDFMSTRITMGGYQPPASVHNRAAAILGGELARQLGDRIEFVLQGNMPESHGIKAIDLLDLVEGGELTICYFAGSYLAGRVPEVGIFDLPFVIESREKAYGLLDGGLGGTIRKKFLDNTGFRVLAFWDNGFRHFSNGVRQLNSPADCAGLKVQTMNSELHQETFRLLGMEPAFVDVADLVEAARSGRIDVQENPLTNTYRFGTYRHHRYITLTGHFFGICLVLINAAQYEALDADVREALDAAIPKATEAQREFAQAEDEEVLANLSPDENDVHELTHDERKRFADAVAPLVERHRRVLGDAVFRYID